MRFFDSYIGMYVIQTVVHSVVTLLLVEMSLRIWQVDGAQERFRYRLQVIILPFFMYPFFQLINPGRGSFYFVEDASVFSSMRWLRLELFGKLPLLYPFLLLLLCVSAIVVIQEVIPIARDILSKGRDGGNANARSAGPEIDSLVGDMCRNLKIEKPAVMFIESEYPVIFTTGTRNHAIVFSDRLLSLFNKGQIKSALAHELAHIIRRSNMTTLLVFLFRICMFYNPVSLLEFRRLVQDDEHICDDMTVAITGDPGALASALRIFCLDESPRKDLRIAEIPAAIENSSHNILLQERIARLEKGDVLSYYEPRWGRYILTLASAVALNYFVV